MQHITLALENSALGQALQQLSTQEKRRLLLLVLFLSLLACSLGIYSVKADSSMLQERDTATWHAAAHPLPSPSDIPDRYGA